MPTQSQVAARKARLGRGAETLMPLAVRYLHERRARGELTKGSVTVYESVLFDFCEKVKVGPDRLAQRHVLKWLELTSDDPRFRGRERAPRYRRQRRSIVHLFCEWLVITGKLDRDPTLGLGRVRVPETLPRYLSEEEVADLLDVIGDERLRLAVLVAVHMGLRAGEVVRIELGDIDRAGRRLHVRGKGGGGALTRTVPITEEVWEALVPVLTSLRSSSGPLIRSLHRPDAGVTRGTLSKWCTAAMLDAGVKHYPGDGRSFHALRHTCAQHLVDAGVPTRIVQKLLGHASVAMTEKYLLGEVKGLRAVVEGRRYERERQAA